jgi:hypothetical protein
MIDFSDFTTIRTLDDELRGFDLDLVVFDCHRELTAELIDTPPEERPPWRCPFDPGCGATTWRRCPLMARQALITRAPEKVQ